METIEVGGRAFTALFPELFVPLSEDQLASLAESVRLFGVRAPVVVDEGDGVIDGLNRLRVAARLGLAGVPVDVRPGLSPGHKRELAESLNLDRRHLSPEEQARRRAERDERIAERRRAGASFRDIARAEGVSPSTARAAVAARPDAQPETVTGRDGKIRPARRARATQNNSKSTAHPRAVEAPPPELAGEETAYDRAVAVRPEMEGHLHHLKRALADLRTWVVREGRLTTLHIDYVTALQDVVKAVAAAVPGPRCPDCGGHGCGGCAYAGYRQGDS